MITQLKLLQKGKEIMEAKVLVTVQNFFKMENCMYMGELVTKIFGVEKACFWVVRNLRKSIEADRIFGMKISTKVEDHSSYVMKLTRFSPAP